MENKYYHTKESVEEYIKMAADVNSSQIIDKLKPHLPEGSSLLELGSGPGTDWKILNDSYRATGSDNSKEFLNRLKIKYPEGNFIYLDAVTLKTNKKFDCIYSNKVLHHLNDKELKLSVTNQTEILNEGGIICHSFWKGDGSEVFKGMFVNYHTEQSLTHVFSKHFKIIIIEEYNEFDDGDSLFIIAQKK